MALPKRLDTVVFKIHQQGAAAVEYAVTTQNVNFEVTPEYFSGSSYKESIGGKRISDIRGFRVKISLSYGASNQADDYQNLFNDLLSIFRDGSVFSTGGTFDSTNGLKIRVGLSGTLLASRFIIEDLSYTQTYRDQIGRFVPSITLCSESIITSIPDSLEGVL